MQELVDSIATPLCKDTVEKVVREAGLQHSPAKEKPALKEKDVARRLAFAEAHKNTDFSL